MTERPDTAVQEHVQCLPATYLEAIYLGLTTSHLVSLPQGGEMVVRRMSGDLSATCFEPGQPVKIGWDTAHARLHTS